MKRRDFLAQLGAQTALVAGADLALAAAAGGPERVRAWVGATLWSGDGQTVEDATLLVVGERVGSVTRGAPIPANAEIIQARGRIITPGWVAVDTPLGMSEIEPQPSTDKASPRGDGHADPIRAAYSVADGYNPLSTLSAVARRGGVTSAVVTPRGGSISGIGAWVDLIDRFPGNALIRDDLVLCANLSELRDGDGPSPLARLRDALESARLSARSLQAHDQVQARTPPFSPLALQRLAQLLSGSLPFIVRVARGADILRLLELGKSYQLRLILSGAEEGWMVAHQIAQASVPVILNPLKSLATSASALNARPDNAVLLAEAGVPLMFSPYNSHRLHNLRHLAGNAVATGLSRAVATRALAFEAAHTFGVASDYGQLAPGRLANFSVWTGDPFELDTWAEDVVLRGHSASKRSRQTELFERYRDLSAIPRGRAGLSPSTR
jgi:imidazolonepropionase-like amidohydrolase